MMPFEDLNRFYDELRHSRPHATALYYGSNYNGYEVMRELMTWFDAHYFHCQFFNGFSIAKPRGRAERDSTVIVRCSCGSSKSIPSDIWHLRLNNIDLEDIIEDMNYQCQGRTFVDFKTQLECQLHMEMQKWKTENETILKRKYREVQEKKGVNAILGLEI